ncbi:MAG: SDR family oxidoreductase [Elusimicrobia bacterium]|nr:SDR family oxidoreductase [Elusimicrobiota bacterium]
MKILLTGASCELGRRLYRRLKAEPRFSGASFLLMRHKKPVEAAEGDEVLDASLTELSELPPLDAILHFAAVSHSADLESYRRVNLEGTRRLLKAASGSGIRQFVFLSSRCQGEAGGAYSLSKTLAEHAIQESALPWTIFRPAEILGEQYGRGITQFVAMARRWRIFPVILSATTLAPIGLDDTVEAVTRSLLNPVCLGKTYTLAGPRDYRFVDIWRLLDGASGRRVLPIPVPAAFLRAACALTLGSLAPDQAARLLVKKSSDSSAAIRDLGFKPRPLEELLRA